MSKRLIKIFWCLSVCMGGAFAQESKWATPDDPNAKYIVNSERKWAEAACTQSRIEATILANEQRWQARATLPDVDTWLKRNGNWQVIAAQDAYFPCIRSMREDPFQCNQGQPVVTALCA